MVEGGEAWSVRIPRAQVDLQETGERKLGDLILQLCLIDLNLSVLFYTTLKSAMFMYISSRGSSSITLTVAGL